VKWLIISYVQSRFPVISGPDSTGIILEDSFTEFSKTSLDKVSLLEGLPTELLVRIVSELDIHTFLSLSRAIRNLRAILMKPIFLDTIAREQKWYRPGQGPASEDERNWWDSQVKKLEEERPGSTGLGFDWSYLKRCYRSPSMKNRKRIWRCVEQIERKVLAFEAGQTGELLLVNYMPFRHVKVLRAKLMTENASEIAS
jgi:hypothetical protein